MSEWITDRLPTEADADEDHCVWWTSIDGEVVLCYYEDIKTGEVWAPKPKPVVPAPYVKPEPQRWKPDAFEIYWVVLNNGKIDKYLSDVEIDDYTYDFGNCFKKERHAIEAARRVRELLLNYHKELLQ
jgi:hypothetical protein